MQKIIKPYIDRPFIPQEVEKIAEPKRKIFDDNSMQSAILVGPKDNNKGGLEEKPSMYSTVIERHATTVVHPVPQPTNYAVHQDAAKAFDTSSELHAEVAKLQPGAYSIPVQLGKSSDPTLSGYETPSFIHKGEKTTGEEKLPAGNIHAPPSLQDSMKQDIETFVAQFDNAKDKQERISVRKININLVMQGRDRLFKEHNALAKEIEADLIDLLFAKEVAVRLNQLIAQYETKMTKDQLSKLKLADEVTIKNILRDKLQREMQGFRTSSLEFKELDIVNPNDIANIIHDIKLKLGQ